MPAASAKRSPCCRPPTLERDSFVFAKVHLRHEWGISVKFSQDRTYKTFGVVALAESSLIYAGSTASQFALGTKRQVATSASLVVTGGTGVFLGAASVAVIPPAAQRRSMSGLRTRRAGKREKSRSAVSSSLTP